MTSHYLGQKLWSWFPGQTRVWMGHGKESYRCDKCRLTFVGVAVDKKTLAAWASAHVGQCKGAAESA